MSDNYHSSSKPWRIFSMLISAIMIVSFIVPINTNTAYALDIPQPISPEDFATTTPDTDSYPPLGVPSFTWSAVEGATKYRLQVDSEIGFSAPIAMNITTANTSYTPASTGYLFADGEWYWQVRVEAPVVGEWSELMTFTKSWVTKDDNLNQPILIEPENNATLAFFDNSVFSWTPVIGAAKYRFQIATDEGFSSIIPIPDTITTTIQPNDRLENGEYWWRVIPMDAADHLGATSEPRAFTMAYGTYVMNQVPNLLEPLDDEDPDYTPPTFTPTFHWEAVEGAENYRLEFTSAKNCDFKVGTAIETRQTFYTPIDTFPNDKEYCWHVRVESGPAVGDWSETWNFTKQWYLRPVLLTPTNKYETALYPLFSWTPVPGAARYHIEISLEVDFDPLFEEGYTANTTYAIQKKYTGTDYYYWRVTPIDGGGNEGKFNDPQFEYQNYYTSTAPILVYPQYYYKTNNYGKFTMNPVEDRTVAYPIFIWNRVLNPAPEGGVYSGAYRIQVDDYPPYFDDPVWISDTENTSATPILVNDFTYDDGQVYYWRVCPLDHLKGNCLKDPNGQEWWSQIWQTHFDPTYDLSNSKPWVLPPTNDDAPQLLRPAHGQEIVEATPLLEWWPYKNSTQTIYQVEVSRDAGFSSVEISKTVDIPAYSPSSLVQRSLGRTDYGTYYWHVRGFVNGVPSNWSDTWRFQIASQSEWRLNRSLGDEENQLLIGEDPTGDVITPTQDLTTLYASQSKNHWYFGFNANLTYPDIYVIYLDLDHVDGSGAPFSPPLRDYSVTTIPAHQPEYAIYVGDSAGVIDAAHSWVFTWDDFHGEWDYGQRFIDIAEAAVYTSTDYVELRLPYTAIGMSLETASASVMLFNVNSNGEVEDSVPEDPFPENPEVPGSVLLSRFSAVSEFTNLIYPQNSNTGDATGDPRTYPSLPPFYWDWPTGSDPSSPFTNNTLELHLDEKYTNPKASTNLRSYSLGIIPAPESNHFAINNNSILDDIVGDNVYYWRIHPKYTTITPIIFGAWSAGWSFRRLGFTAKNLQTSVNWATPTFSWDMAEGANTYRLQVSTDPNFGSTAINQVTPMTSYTPVGTLAEGIYYWRVQVIRYNNIGNDWSDVAQFDLRLPPPTGLEPDNNKSVRYTPTFCWAPLIKYNEVYPFEPILTAWKYRVQVSRDENFSAIYDSVTTDNNCWTPTKGYDDGTYWWRVAMVDGNGKVGSNSPAVNFTKQYPMTTLRSPVGGVSPQTPTFIWDPVNGAATYLFEVSKYPTFSPIYDTITTINTQYTPIKIYDRNLIYYWRVAIRDRNGRQGPFTGATILIGAGNNTFLPLIKR